MFRLLVTNVCGLMSKFGEFCYTVHTHSLDIVIATESKRTEAKMTTQETVTTGYTAPPPPSGETELLMAVASSCGSGRACSSAN